MTQSPKVVPLKATEGSAARPVRKLPPILHTVRQTARRSLSELVNTLFNNADDVLFEMADRSRNDADQHMYFDSMREIRVHRKRITTEFGQQLYARFDQLFEATDTEAADAVDFDTAVDSLSLVQNDDLEVAVAVAGIVSKVTSRFSLPIMQLTRRIDSVCPERTVTERLNPLGPYQLGDAFVAATEHLAIDIRVRIVLLKLFERFVMEHLGQCYEQANRLLAEAGVLPDLRNVMKREVQSRSTERAPHTPTSTQPPVTASTGAAGGTGQGSGGAAEFSVLQQLLAGNPASGIEGGTGAGIGGGESYAAGGGAASGTATASGVPGGLTPQGPLITTPQLMIALAAAQTDARAEPIDIDHPPLAIDLRQLVLTEAARATGNAEGSLGRSDDDTVNLVGMLFDYILNDRNLAIPMKALIGRLQIPMLKVAILDKTFFSKTSHPARQLLNELSSAGIGWSSSAELKRDALYNKIESVVLRVLNNFSDDLTLFTTLVAELRKFVQQDHHRVQIVEQRVKEVEAGRAKTAAAKQIVERLINQKASGLRLPQDIGRFISDVWSRVLVYLCVRNGSEGPEWSNAIQTFDDLLWAVQPLDELAAVDQRDGDRDGLLDRLEGGMELIGLAGSEIEAALAMLRKRLSEIADSDRAFLADDRQPVETPDVKIMEEIVLTTPTEARELEDVEPEPEMVREINRLTEGVWVEISHEDGDKTRCKLAAIVKPGNRYVFVNRRGMKVAERTRMALAVELKRRSIVILDESQVFDRALAAVIGNLRQLQRQPS